MLPLTRGEKRIYTKGKKVGNFYVSTTFVHDCRVVLKNACRRVVFRLLANNIRS